MRRMPLQCVRKQIRSVYTQDRMAWMQFVHVSALHALRLPWVQRYLRLPSSRTHFLQSIHYTIKIRSVQASSDSMMIQDLCIDQKVGELSSHLLNLSKISLRKSSPLQTVSSSDIGTTSCVVKPNCMTTKRVRHRKRSPIHKKSYVVPQSTFVQIAPKLHLSDQPRHIRSCPDHGETSPPVDRPPRAGALFWGTIPDTQGVREVDLLYMRMTPAERVVFRLPGTSVLQSRKCKQNMSHNVVYHILTCLAITTKEAISTYECSSWPSCRIPKIAQSICDLSIALPHPPNLPSYASLVEHCSRKETW